MNMSFHQQLLSQLLTAAKEKYGPLGLELRNSIQILKDPDALEALLSDLHLCPDSEVFHRNVYYHQGHEMGQIQGMQDAIVTLAAVRDDEAAEEISEAAFCCWDMEKLERLLLQLTIMIPPSLN